MANLASKYYEKTLIARDRMGDELYEHLIDLVEDAANEGRFRTQWDATSYVVMALPSPERVAYERAIRILKNEGFKVSESATFHNLLTISWEDAHND